MRKRIVFLVILILALSINTTVFGKYVIEYTSIVANIDIDRNPPQIVMMSIGNTNKGYEKYANQTHTITAKIKVIEKNVKQNNFNENNLEILVGGIAQNVGNMKITQIENKSDYIIYEVVLEKILGNGKLEIKVNAGTIIDKSDNKNVETKIETGIQIDNTAPITTFEQEVLNNGKVNAKITANECIRDIEGWEISNDKLSINKEFPSNILYNLEVTDFAQNSAEIEVNITQATNIQINYAAFKFGTAWSFAKNNNGIAGKEFIESTANKIEIMAFNIEGEVDDDFIQVQNYLHTYWGEGSEAISAVYEYKFHHGYIPKDSYCCVKKGGDTYTNRAYVENKIIYTLLGGSGINEANSMDLTYRKKIPKDVATQNLFGVSALSIKLKDYSEYSIVYQIYIKDYGWLTPASDGEESSYAHDKPMTAYRISLVPKTEKIRMIQTWNKDVGTSNVN